MHPIHAVVRLLSLLEHIYSKRKTIISTGMNTTVKIEDSAEEKSVAPSKKQVSC